MENDRPVYIADSGEYMRKFDKLFNDILFTRQESGYLHNTEEWGNWICNCLIRHDKEGILNALNAVSVNYNPGKLSSNSLRSGKNLIITLIAVMVHFAVRDRIIDNELGLTAADACILLCEETESGPDLRRAAYTGLCKISDLIRNYREREYHYLVKQAKVYVFKHMHEEIYIKDMAETLGVSPEHLSRTFHNTEKVTLKQYIMDERIERAKALLRLSRLSIAEIARYMAFSSQSHFAALFKQRTGKSPTIYRQDFSDYYIENL